MNFNKNRNDEYCTFALLPCCTTYLVTVSVLSENGSFNGRHKFPSLLLLLLVANDPITCWCDVALEVERLETALALSGRLCAPLSSWERYIPSNCSSLPSPPSRPGRRCCSPSLGQIQDHPTSGLVLFWRLATSSRTSVSTPSLTLSTMKMMRRLWILALLLFETKFI